MFYFRKGKSLSFKKRAVEIIYNLTTDEKDIGLRGTLVESGTSDNLQDAIDFFNKDTDITLIINKVTPEEAMEVIAGVGKNLAVLDCWASVTDCSDLEKCPELISAKFSLGESIKKIWNVRKNPKLSELVIYNAKELTDVEGLRDSNIENLTISGGHLAYFDVTEYPKILDISPITSLKKLKRLEYITAPNPSLVTKDLVLLSTLSQLEYIKLARNYFTFSQFAWLKSKLPLAKELDASYYFLYQRWDETEWYAIIGSDMPDWIQDIPENNLDVYFKNFDELVELYKDSVLPPNE